MEEVGYGAKRFDFLSKLTMAPSYFSSKMNIVLAHDLYPQSTEGDEPEPLPQVRWPIADMMALLAEPDFREARNVSALFLSEAFCALRADTLRAKQKGPDFSGPFRSEQLVAFTARIGQRGAGIARWVVRRLSSFDEVLGTATAATARELAAALVDGDADDARWRRDFLLRDAFQRGLHEVVPRRLGALGSAFTAGNLIRDGAGYRRTARSRR